MTMEIKKKTWTASESVTIVQRVVNAMCANAERFVNVEYERGGAEGATLWTHGKQTVNARLANGENHGKQTMNAC